MANTNVVANYPGVQEVVGMVISPNGGQVLYVGTAAQVAALGETGECIASRVSTTINAALAQCVSGRGDVVYVLPGYTESISTADAWSNLGTKTNVSVVGIGTGTSRPAITWTAAAATVLFDQAGFKVRNMQLFLAGPHAAGTALTVAAPITISAASCEITDCDIFWGFDADQIVNIGITTTAAADDLIFDRNYCFAEVAAVPTTTFLRLTGVDRLRMNNTTIIGPGSTTAIGPVQMLTTVCLQLELRNCVISNSLASSTAAVTGLASCTGNIYFCGLGIFSGTAPWTNVSGIWTHGCYYSVGGGAASVLF